MKKAEKASTRHAHKFLIKRLDTIRTARRHIIEWLLLVGFLIAATGVQLAWAQSSYQTVATAEGGTYAEAVTGQIETLNPLYATTEPEVAASRLLFSSLYTYDVTGMLHQRLAESMSVDETGKIYTITIRPDAYWHDGVPLTAKDIAFTINLIKKPAAMSPLRINWQDVNVKAVNDTTVEFQLPALYAAFPYALTFAILPSHILGDVPAGAIRENTFSRYPIGSGPFEFRLMQTVNGKVGHKIIQMAAFDKYYRGAPSLNRFEIHAYDTKERAVKSLKAGEVNAAFGVPATAADDLEKGGFSISSHAVDSGVYALFNVSQPILKDKAVRQALQSATDAAALRKGLAVDVPGLDLPFVNGQLTGDDVPKAPAPDKAKAAALLDQAGWKLEGDVRQKDGQKLALTITTTQDDEYEKIMEGMAAQWRDIGVEISTSVIDPDAPGANFLQNVLQPRNYDILIYELLIGADPDVYAYWHSSQIGSTGYNFSNYSNPVSDAALVSARSRLESDLRNIKYKTFAQQWLEDVPAIGLYQPVVLYAASEYVNSVPESMPFVTSSDHYANVLDWTVRERTVNKTP
jgi:peptide/nickel transport system substrate-binding protein